MTTEEVVSLFKELISLMELSGENPFKIRAYEKSIENLNALSEDLSSLVKKIDSGQSLGFGPQILKDLREIYSSGALASHQVLLKEYPKEILELLNIRGLGPKKIIQLKQELGITSIEGFQKALIGEQLDNIKGFGKKTLVSLKENLDLYLDSREYFLLDAHEKTLERLLALAPNELLPEQLTLEKSETFTSVEVAIKRSSVTALRMNLEANKLSYTEESDKLLLSINSIPIRINLKNSFDYTTLIEQNDTFNRKPKIDTKSLKGLLHMHSTYSDGKDSIKDLALEAIRLGYSYIGITDHSQSAGYAGGLRPEAIKQQHTEINRLNEELAPFRIFKGIESDILTDGSLDYNEGILSSFDFIVSSIHSGFTLSKAEMTKRIITALKNPHTTILGHLTGRLLLKRKPYEVDVDEILKVAKEEGVVVELNSNPKRLDISWEELAKNTTNLPNLAITPDAHSKEQLSLVRYGILMANKADIKEKSILNTRDAKECSNFFKLRK